MTTLFLTGLLLTFFAYFVVKSAPLGALGVSATIIGLTAIFINHSSSKNSWDTKDLIIREKLKRFLLLLAAALGGVDAIILAFDREAFFSVYFIANALVFIVMSLAYSVEFGAKAKTGLNAVATIIFVIFVALVAYKISLYF